MHRSVPSPGTTREQSGLLPQWKRSFRLPTSQGIAGMLSLERGSHDYLRGNRELRGVLSRIQGPPGEITLG